MTELAGKVALVTGGSRGIGAAIATRLAELGSDVAITYAQSKDRADEVVDTIKAHGRRGLAIKADSAAADEVVGAVGRAIDEFGRLDVLVNNAGIVSFASVADVEPAEFRRVMDVNVTGTLLGIKSCTPLLIRSGGGSIVNISSISGLKGAAESAAYVASKWAVRGLTKAAAVDLASQGIRVNSVHPGVIDTPLIMRPGSSRDEILARHLPRLLVPRLGTPDDVVPLVLFLASREAAYVTGAEFVVDGGWTVR
jgi:NAD(P)-dependent dehydrogenase (short-subunit alcohol dehydrogenase family)